MAGPRVFISYAQESPQDAQFAYQLIEDLREAELEPVTFEDQQHVFTEENFVQELNEKLRSCQWVFLVQTSKALASPHVQLTINTALNLALQKRIHGVLAMAAEPVPTQEIPPTWTTLRTFDASQDYSRALARLLLALQPDIAASRPTMPTQVAPPPVFSVNIPVQDAKVVQGAAMQSFDNDIPLPLTQAAWFRRKRVQQWFVPLVLALAIIVIVPISIGIFVRSSGTQVKASTATPNAIATATTTAANQTALAVNTANTTATSTAVHAGATATALAVAANSAATATVNQAASAAATSTAAKIEASAAATSVAANNAASATAAANNAASATAVAMDPMTIYNNAMQQPIALNDPLSAQDGNDWAVGFSSAGTTSTGNCGFSNNSYSVSTNSSQANQNQKTVCLARNTQFSNFAYQAQMTFTSTPSVCGLVFRATNANVSSYRFYISSNGTYDFYGYPDAQNQVHPSIDQKPTNVNMTNQTNTITVIAMGSLFYLYINGNFITRETAPANGAASGMIGMACRMDDQNMTSSTANFQSVQIRNLP